MPARLARLVPICAALLALAAPARAARMLADSTSVDGWTLANGLRVVVRQVPGATSTGVVVAYPAGRDDDPEGQEGLTELMAESAFMAAAGELPARSRADLDSQRPVGWNVSVAPRHTEFAEMATHAQFPGVLHAVALRMRGVRLTDAIVDSARIAIAERRARTLADLGNALYLETGQMAAGWDHARFERWASGAGIEKLRARDLADRIAESYVPARAVLSLTGDFTGIPLREFVRNEFGGIPAGTPRANVMPEPARGPASDVVAHSHLDLPAGCIAIAAPALSDSLHPSFYLTTLLLGTFVNRNWSGKQKSVPGAFRYSLLDDPSLVRFYPPILTTSWTPANMRSQFAALMKSYEAINIELKQVKIVQKAVEWILGGPLPRSLLERIDSDPAVIYQVCSTAATRELWGGEAFWSEYRRRFDPAKSAGDEHWPGYMQDPEHIIGLVYAP